MVFFYFCTTVYNTIDNKTSKLAKPVETPATNGKQPETAETAEKPACRSSSRIALRKASGKTVTYTITNEGEGIARQTKSTHEKPSTTETPKAVKTRGKTKAKTQEKNNSLNTNEKPKASVRRESPAVLFYRVFLFVGSCR